ncbi:Uu.00g033270.m01.CDS01 [Anthostomella pinea]|uniref:Uu.00g033270.m01.CDS01 n=1 Tax=Anthostomella pinea TaxID=933095 RepID=A0AAI8YAV0_9PEZI|nr:Uu.00g033270.m01.CDS01 [Anthostomella pinea]
MASLQTMSASAFGSHGRRNKVSKPRAKGAVVKPILKKIQSQSRSQSEQSSLDLDRGWHGQGGEQHYRGNGGGWGTGAGAGAEGGLYQEQQAISEAAVVSSSNNRSGRYNHSRSISGTSHVSHVSHVSVATSNSSNGFVHPFQQMPRNSTPPLSLSYAPSMTSFVDSRDYSPTTITEDDNQYSHRHHQQPTLPMSNSHSASHSQPSLGLRRPSLASQRTSSFSDTRTANPHPPPPLRINTSRTTSSTTPAQSSRLVNVSSRSDLYLDRTSDSPTALVPPSTSVAPMSPLRTSLDAGGFRLRAKSDLDTATRAEHLREARLKFERKERAKDEKYAREEIKRRERADNKRAQEQERHAVLARKEQLAVQAREEAAELEEAMLRRGHDRKISIASSGRPSLAMSRPSLSHVRTSTSRKSTMTPQLVQSEKFAASNYDSTDPLSPPAFGDEAGGAQGVVFQTAKRKNSAKKKTQSTWNMFILWLRTKLLRVGKH